MNGPLRRLGTVVGAMFTVLLLAATWTQFVAAPSLRADGRNARTFLDQLGRDRGPITVDGDPVARSVPSGDQYRYQREYPAGALYAHATGYYSVTSGATGLERAEDGLLSGTSDALFYRRLSDLVTGRKPGGAVVETTLDPAVQQAAWDALGDQRGAAVALDPRTGEVLALVSKPSYDPAALADHDGEAALAAAQRLQADPGRPLEDRAIASRGYPPGSTFKLVVAAAALERGDTPSTVLDAPDVLELPQTTATLPNAGGESCGPDGKATLADALRISCNTAFASLGTSLGEKAITDQAAAFGFGTTQEIPLRVTPSVVPTGLNPPQLAQTSIGQFDVRVTPMQVAMVSAGIANGGVVMAPQMVRSVRGADLEVISSPRPRRVGRAVSEGTAKALTTMMEGVVEDGTGTAARIPGVAVAGKTGTAEHGTGAPPHAWFTAFAPADDPQIAVAVVVEDGGGNGTEASGGRTAAPIAQRMMAARLGEGR